MASKTSPTRTRPQSAKAKSPIGRFLGGIIKGLMWAWRGLGHLLGSVVRSLGNGAKDVDPALRIDGIGFLFFALALISAAGSWFKVDGWLTSAFLFVTESLFGAGHLIWPLFFLWLSIRSLRNPTEIQETSRISIGILGLVISLLGLWHIAQGAPGFDDGALAMNQAAGFFGVIITSPLISGVSTGFAIAILILFTFFSLLIITKTPLKQVPARIMSLVSLVKNRMPVRHKRLKPSQLLISTSKSLPKKRPLPPIRRRWPRSKTRSPRRRPTGWFRPALRTRRLVGCEPGRKGRRHFTSRMGPGVGVLFHHAEKQFDERRRRVGPLLEQVRRRRAKVRLNALGERALGERWPPREQVVEGAAERVDVGPVVDRGAVQLLWRHVVRRAGQHRLLTKALIAKTSEAKVEQLERAVARHQHVVGLDVAVNEPLRVGVVERVGQLIQN